MARIRSIKPEFWTSEVVASWGVETRLTFIGLWSYVDDNGVGVANERLIASSIYPMDDPAEALARVREALAKISAGGQIVLFEARGKRLLFVTGWDDHQRVDHPAKSRYPRPSDLNTGPPTSKNGLLHESLDTPSDGSREYLAKPSLLSREQGAGSREQGEPRKRGTAAPDHLLVTADMRAWAERNGITVDLSRETDQFLDHHRAKATRFKDWHRAWQTWMRNTLRWGGVPVPSPGDDPAVTGQRRVQL